MKKTAFQNDATPQVIASLRDKGDLFGGEEELKLLVAGMVPLKSDGSHDQSVQMIYNELIKQKYVTVVDKDTDPRWKPTRHGLAAIKSIKPTKQRRIRKLESHYLRGLPSNGAK